jgi:hypothetical protein
MAWTEDDEKCAGLYRANQYKIERLDVAAPPLPKDEAIRDGRIRSRYYDWEWRRPNASPQSMAAELDRSFGGSTATFFDPILLHQQRKHLRPPAIRGDLINGHFVDSPGGQMAVWTEIEDTYAKKSEYSLGVDVAAGTGGSASSYSVISVIDKRTASQVAEWRSLRTTPVELAPVIIAIAKFFWSAFVVIEATGPLGRLCCQETSRLNCPNLYYREGRGINMGMHATYEKVGYDNRDRGVSLFGGLQRGFQSGGLIVRSELVLDELGQYFYKDGELRHSRALSTLDESAKGKAHSDAAIAFALAWFGVETWPPSQQMQTADVPPDSFLARRLEYQRSPWDGTQLAYW